MKISTTMIATAMVALPLSLFAGDKDKAGAMSTSSDKQFKTLDSNGDGRISQNEASSDSKIVFSTADRNQDGFIDNKEFSNRAMSQGTMPSDAATPSDATTPKQQ